MREAQLEEVGSGLAPVSDGWFVVNVRDAAWLTNDAFGARCVFEGGMPVLRSRPDLPAHKFAQLGFTLQVLRPGQPSGLYHAESNQEDFLVLAGECLLLVEGKERPLKAWDFAALPARHQARLRGRRRRPVRHLHDGRASQGGGHGLSPLRAGSPSRRRGRDGDAFRCGGVCPRIRTGSPSGRM